MNEKMENEMGEMKAGSMPRCKSCPYCGHGFICCGKDGRCMRTETARINHFKIVGEQAQGNTDDAQILPQAEKK